MCEFFKRKRYEEIFRFLNSKSRGFRPCFNCSTYWNLAENLNFIVEAAFRRPLLS